MRHMYHEVGVTDLDKMRAHAVEKSKGDSRNEPELVTIHKHKKTERCFGAEHEDYKDGEHVPEA
jgi:hypothetical protein